MVPDDDFDFDKELDKGLPAYGNPEDNKGDEKKDDAESNNDDGDEKDGEEEEDDDFTFDDDKSKKEDKEDNEGDEEEEPKKKKGKDVSIANLRTQRDEARTELESWREAAGDLDVDTIKNIRAFIEEGAGDDLPTPEVVRQVLAEASEWREEKKTLEEKLTEQDKVIRELDIRHSSEFNNQFVKPLQDSASDLHVEISNLDADGKVIAPKSTESFHAAIMKEKDMNPQKMKQMLTVFKKNFKEESGIDYDAPAVSAVMSAYRGFANANKKLEDAYQGWDKQKKESIQKSKREQEEADAHNRIIAKKERKAEAVSGMRTFDLDLVDGVYKPEDVQSMFRKVYKEAEEIFDDPSKTPKYSELMQRSVKGEMFDRLVKEYKKLKKWKDSQDEEDDDKSKDRGDKSRKKSKQDDEDWMTV